MMFSRMELTPMELESFLRYKCEKKKMGKKDIREREKKQGNHFRIVLYFPNMFNQFHIV